MNKEKIKKTIETIESLLQELKLDLNVSDNNDAFISLAKKSGSRRKRKEGPAKWIGDLISSGFFDTYKTLADVLEEFRKRALKGEMPTVSKELTRAVRKTLLIRDGKGVNRNPWKYKRGKV
jgi:hypothetical protein